MLPRKRLFQAGMAVLLTTLFFAAGQAIAPSGAGATGGPSFMSCSLATSPLPQLRADGVTELVADLVLTCTGGVTTGAGQLVPQANITVFANTSIENPTIAPAGSGLPPLTDATLLVDDPPAADQTACDNSAKPGPSGPYVCAVNGNGSGTEYGNGAPNVYYGFDQSSNALTWYGVPLDPPVSGQLTLRFTGIRVDAAQLGGGQVEAFVSISTSTSVQLTNTQAQVGLVARDLALTLPSTPTCSGGSTSGTLQLGEDFAGAFRTRTTAGTGAANQDVPGQSDGTESGFVNSAMPFPSAGLANWGTRVALTLSGPAGTTVTLPTALTLDGPGGTPDGTLTMVAVVTAPYQAVSGSAATVTLPGSAAYEVTATANTAVESAAVPFTAAGEGSGTIGVVASLGPSLQQAPSAVPRFVGGTGQLSVHNACSVVVTVDGSQLANSGQNPSFTIAGQSPTGVAVGGTPQCSEVEDPNNNDQVIDVDSIVVPAVYPIVGISCSGVFAAGGAYAVAYTGNFYEYGAVLESGSQTYGSSDPTYQTRALGNFAYPSGSVVCPAPTVDGGESIGPGLPVGQYTIDVATCTGTSSNGVPVEIGGGSFVVGPAPLSIDAVNASITYGGALPSFSYTSSGLVDGDTITSIGLAVECSTTASSRPPVGQYPITCTGPAATANYTVSYQPGVLTVGAAELTITAADVGITYGAALPTFAYTVSGLVDGDTISSIGLVVSCSTTAASPPAAGQYPITCTGPATTANYTVTYAAGSLTVGRAALEVTADNAAMDYGASVPAFSVTPAGLENGDTIASIGLQATCSSDAPAAPQVGLYPITCSGPASTANYAVTYTAGTLSVEPAVLTVVADTARKTYGAGLPALGFTVQGLQNGDTVASIGLTVVCATSATAASGVGSYAITCAPTRHLHDYTTRVVAALLAVEPASLVVVAPGARMTLGVEPPAIAPVYRGFVNGDTASSLTRLPSCATIGTSSTPVGTYRDGTSCSGAEDPDYFVSYVDGTLVVVAPPDAVLTIDETVADATAQMHTADSFTIAVANDGPSSAANVVLRESLPGGLDLRGFQADRGTAAAAGGSGIVWTIGTLAVGATATLQIDVVVATSPQTVVDEAAVTDSTYDPRGQTQHAQAKIVVTALVVPATHTGKPWSGWDYWLLVGLAGFSGTLLWVVAVRRRRLEPASVEAHRGGGEGRRRR